jgi:hypothetical protein
MHAHNGMGNQKVLIFVFAVLFRYKHHFSLDLDPTCNSAVPICSPICHQNCNCTFYIIFFRWYGDVTSEVNTSSSCSCLQNINGSDWGRLNKEATNKCPTTYTHPLTENCALRGSESSVFEMGGDKIILLWNNNTKSLELRKGVLL